MHCESIPTIELINTSIVSLFFFLVRPLKIYSKQISIIHYRIINCSHHAIHYFLSIAFIL